MSNTRLVSVSPSGTVNAYKGKTKFASINVDLETMTPEYLEYYRKYPLRAIDELNKEETEDGTSPA